MDSQNGKKDLDTVLETIFLFLKNQNFYKSSEAFKNDCEEYGIRLPNISGKVFFRTDEKLGTIDNCIHSSRKFMERRIILETFLERPDEDVQRAKSDDSENTSKRQQGSLRNKFGQLQEEYRNLLAITSELTNALQLNIVNQAKNVNLVLDQCKIIYPSLFRTPRKLEDFEVRVTEQERIGEEKNANQSMAEVPMKDSIENVDETKSDRRAFPISMSNLGYAPVDNLMENVEKESDRRVPSVCTPNFDISKDDNKQIFLHENQAQVPTTPLSHCEMRDMLESVLNRALHSPKIDRTNLSNDCCGHNNACTECTDEISKMLENFLLAVMVSPRCKSSSSNCRHSKENLNLDDGSTPITGTITDSPNLMSSQRDQRSHALNENNVRVLPNEMDSIWKSDRQIFHKLKNESQIRPHSSGGCEKKQKIKENTRCSTWSHLGCLKERGNILPPTKIVVDEIQNAYDQRMQEAQVVYSNTEMKKGSRVDPSENIPLRIMDKEKKSVKPFQKFVKFQTPLCYLEICRRLQDGNKNCRCTYCVPGKNRYYCGCYDVICKEIAEETNDIDNGDEDVTCRKINFFKNFYNQGEITGPNILEHHMCNDKRCSVCEDVICKCAFESRPKIRRTPPE